MSARTSLTIIVRVNGLDERPQFGQRVDDDEFLVADADGTERPVEPIVELVDACRVPDDRRGVLGDVPEVGVSGVHPLVEPFAVVGAV